MTEHAIDHVDIYPVGLLSDLLSAWRYLVGAYGRSGLTSAPPWAWRIGRAKYCLRQIPRRFLRYVRARKWHELRQYLNGYLAEPYHWPQDGSLTKCGRGWTKAAAMRSLRRRGWTH